MISWLTHIELSVAVNASTNIDDRSRGRPMGLPVGEGFRFANGEPARLIVDPAAWLGRRSWGEEPDRPRAEQADSQGEFRSAYSAMVRRTIQPVNVVGSV
jgi:hypothetical protein